MKGKRKTKLALALAAVMIWGMIPSMALAEGQTGETGGAGQAGQTEQAPVYSVENPNPKLPGDADGLYLDKQLEMNDDGTGTITLETYVEGDLKTSSKPTDIILVLDQSGSMASGGKLEALKSAVTSFVADVKAENVKIQDASKKHRIAIAGFASESEYGDNTELLTVTGDNSPTGTGEETVGKAYKDKLQEADYKASLVLAENGIVDKAIAALAANGATRADLGMEMADQILTNTAAGAKDRNRVVIMFTDGVPTTHQNFDYEVANPAIAKAKAIKDSKATVYTIGLGNSFNQGQGASADVNKFMNYVSSNYPNAKSMTVSGERVQSGEYFKAVKDTGDLKNIFEEINEEIQDIPLDKTSVLMDIMSQYFDVNTIDPVDIKMYISKYTGKDRQGQPTFGNKVEANGLTATIEGDQVSVTGFDFEPVIDGVSGNAVSGKKLTVEIPVKLDQGAIAGLSGEWIPSNNQGETISGVFHDEKLEEACNIPKVLLPKKTVTITAASDSKVYDGSPLSNESYTYTQDVLASGDVLTAQVRSQAEGGLIDAGTAENKVTSYKIMRENQDVTDKYNVVTVSGVLTVSPRPVTLTSASDSKVYDGEPLINHQVTSTLTGSEALGFVGNEGAIYKVTGSQKDVGSSDNEFTYTLNENTKAANYDITTTFGTLTVTKSEETILITAGSDSKIYDGSPLTNDSYTYTEGILAEGDVLTATVEGSLTDAGTAENRITGYRVMRGEEDVTGNYNFAEPVNGALVVSKRPVVLISASDSKIYDGTPLTANIVTDGSGENQGFVSGEGADYTVTGSQTNAGESANTFTYQLKAGTKADNYQITTAEGLLKVSPAVLTVKADNKTKTTGQENPVLTGSITGFVHGEKEADVLKGVPQYGTTAGTDSPAGDYPITASAGTLEAVDGNYVFQFIDGTLTVADPLVPSDSPDKPSIFDGPKTGDGFSPWLLGGLALAALLAAAVTFLARRKMEK